VRRKGSIDSFVKGINRIDPSLTEQFLRAGFSLTKVARAHSLGLRQFERKFRQEFGCEPRQAAHLLRMHLARERITATTALLKEIAADLGYRESGNFSRAFHHFFGLSPVQMRSRDKLRVGPTADDRGKLAHKKSAAVDLAGTLDISI